MTTWQLVIVCGTALAALFVAAGAWVIVALERSSTNAVAEALRTPTDPAVAPTRVGHRVTVHTKKPDDQTIFGVVAADYTDRLVLEHAEYVMPGGTTEMRGLQHIPTANIAWIDVHALVTTGGPSLAVVDGPGKAA